MFVEKLHHPTIEYDRAAGQQEPMLAHFLSTRAEPLKTALPLLAKAGDDERVLVVASPLRELLDETIRLHRDMDYPDMIVVDQGRREFFEAVKASLEQVLAKIDLIQYAALEEDEDED